MMNPYFYAKNLWEAGQQKESIRSLHASLSDAVGRDAFLINGLRAYRPLYRFEQIISVLLAYYHCLSVSFCRVYPSLWRWNQSELLIVELKERDIFFLPPFIKSWIEGEPIKEDFTTTEQDIDAVVEALLASAQVGILSPHHFEFRQSGRIPFPLKDVTAIPHERWGVLKDKLLAQLPEAYAACPPDFWHRLATNDPQHIVTHYLHHTFQDGTPSLKAVVQRIEWSRDHTPDYVQALLVALEHLLTSASPELLTEFAQIDAGVTQVTDGPAWFTYFRDALHGGDLESWQAYTARFWPPTRS